ncbi:histidine--tRNA ligase [Halorhodospira halophila]|uniref:Histidine--tRNA ligase n=1 Tax=Halorhodospira halophila (strain DSM 244 / SL1) TaxID=349124 RepID=SYH_HALHL|nr:histidine--tRNA ligase [Halorhodospira halophila]A1WXZ0.1 RecName: Full=Histidine--tRNA ligase; AltName: Full=Histidyl-tRNA synthetase; Short=HisRS [Halorhodospira halophila SL1]ABM62552.1 histidyl-tRNA synthetase [Halorhodospira halophila SL1]MBK1728231.1 histidine--tRNA ligase [Halorhodospira halophila]
MSNKGIQSIRGFSDILPEESPLWQYAESAIRRVLESYGYREIRLPVLERTELFSRSIGEVTDIVEKEMYTFDDRNGDSVTLRPEGTAGCVRAGIQSGLLHNAEPRLWYAGPMFRHERPQKGRLRQFHQVGAEVFGIPEPELDAEMIIMTARMLRELGLSDVRLQLNSLGTPESRAAHREQLVAYLRRHEDRLDEDARRRLETNPLRIFDSKNPQVQQVMADAPRLMDCLDSVSAEHFTVVRNLLERAGVEYEVNPSLVRGLDYYTRTVFEWVTDRLGAQGTVCAGGRFDGLVEQLGGRPTPAIGFALGLERLVALLEDQGTPGQGGAPHAYLVVATEAGAGLEMAEALRDALPALRVQMHAGGGGFKAQLKRADRSGARVALILGDDEQAAGALTIKDLRGEDGQQRLPLDDAVTYLRGLIGA